MRRLNNPIVSVFILMFVLSFARIALADSDNAGLISRPLLEYSSGNLRDPFIDLLQLAKEKKNQGTSVSPESTGDQESMPNLESYKVQGVIWGGKFPQAIIDDQVLKVGDLVNGAEVVSIERNGVNLNFGGKVVNLTTPGNAPVLVKGD